MALFEGYVRRPGTRSNTKLVVSGGDSPAEKWIVDPELPVLFDYEYGGPGQRDVVIAKGMAVALDGRMAKDFDTGKMVPVLTIANGSNAVIGIAPYNYSKYDPMYFRGNQPAIITREYIELPYIPNADEAANVKWGAVHGEGIKAGDFLKVSSDPNNPGKLTKWVEGVDFVTQIVGQVLAVELDQEPFGWLKWAMWDEAAKREDDAFINRKKGQVPNDDGWPYDPTYRDGTVDMPGYLSQFTTNPTGIPGLTDGAQRNLTIYTYTHVVSAADAGQTIVFNLGKRSIIEIVSAELNGVDVKDSLTVNKKDGACAFQVPAGLSSDETLVIKFRINHPGTLPGWDYKGAVGAIRVLLKF